MLLVLTTTSPCTRMYITFTYKARPVSHLHAVVGQRPLQCTCMLLSFHSGQVSGRSALSNAALLVDLFLQPTPRHPEVFKQHTGHIKKGEKKKRKKGFQARSKDLRGGRWSWTLNLAQKRSWVGRWSWAKKVGLLLLWVVQVVDQQQCNEHCLCDSVQAQQLKQQLRSAQVAGQWRGDTALTLLHCSGGGPRSLRSFSGGFRGRAFTLSFPSHSVPVSNRPSRLRGR